MIGEEGKKTQINPGRYIVSTCDAADAWQNNYILLDTTLLRLAGSPESLPTSGGENISAWLLNTPVPLPTTGDVRHLYTRYASLLSRYAE